MYQHEEECNTKAPPPHLPLLKHATFHSGYTISLMLIVHPFALFSSFNNALEFIAAGGYGGQVN